MKLMTCPLNGPRNIQEFVCAGEVVAEPAANAEGADWSGYVFLHDNAADVVREWWCHVPSSYWFIAERDTRSDEILRSYPASDLFAREDRDPS